MNDKVRQYLRYKKDPWAFLTECVNTLDQVDKKSPIKAFPDREYLHLLTRLWEGYPLLAIPKSRRMTISWTFVSLYVWDTIFNKGRFQAFVSKKEDDANELVNRAKFIIDNIDRSKIPEEFIPKYRSKFCSLEFPDLQSKIQGFPQGADQLRQFTFSGILGDECAFWENAQEFYSASFPTIDGGGRMSLVSSPAPGFFKKLSFDHLDIPGDFNVAEHRSDYETPLEGTRVWKNKKNRFMVYELHYTADPSKRSDSYRESLKNSMPLMEYLREYELHWDTFSGQPVYPEFSKLHKSEKAPVPQPGLPMLIGFDFGLTPAAVVGQYQDGTLHIFKEYIEIGMGADRFADKIIPDIRMRWPEWSDLNKDWLCYIDPSGAFKKDTDENTCARILASKGFKCIPGPVTWEERRHGVVGFLQKLGKDGPCFQIWEKECPVLTKGFEGGYRFSDKAVELEPSKIRPLKDAFSHPHDALQYMCCGVKSLVKKVSKSIPRPHYSIVKQNEDLDYGRRKERRSFSS